MIDNTPTFNKVVLEKVIEFMMEEERSLVFYQIYKKTPDLYGIRFFGLHRPDEQLLNHHINLVYGI